MARIYCFGDSITFGESDLAAGGWVERLKQCYLRQDTDDQHQKTLVYNLGVASETTDGLEKRFATELLSRASAKTENIVILSYGTNDVTQIIDRVGNCKNKVPLRFFINKITSCVEYAREKSMPVIVTTILPIAPKYNGKQNVYKETRTTSDIEFYNQAILDMSNQAGCNLLDLHSEFSQTQLSHLLAKDGLHPNEKGHQLIFNRVKDLLDTLISQG